MEQRPDNNDYREMAKGILDYFPANHNNNFDPAITSLIQQLKQRVQESGEKLAIADDNLKGYEFDENTMTRELEGYIQDQASAVWDNVTSSEELLAILEMQIIYAFKHIEIGMKSVIKGNYKVDDDRNFFIWDKMKAFLKGVGIHLEQLDKYNDIDQLRRVNNNLKHDQKPDGKKLSDIPEFQGKQRFEPGDLERFYTRVQESTEDFIKSFVKSVYEERFEFAPSKIDELANHFHCRMDEKDARAFADALLKLY